VVLFLHFIFVVVVVVVVVIYIFSAISKFFLSFHSDLFIINISSRSSSS